MPRMSAARHLSHLLHGVPFRQLFAVRVSSQLTDGVFQTALASYVIFSPEQAPSPGAIAGALAVVLLPFSVLGPFVGVLLDRWSRRQVLAWSNFVRVVLVALLALGVAVDVRGPALFALILACLSVNRFLLAGLSASLPHVVLREELVMANAVTPTAGTMAFLGGLALGAATRFGWSALGVDADVGVLASPRRCCTASPGRWPCASRTTCWGRTSTRRGRPSARRPARAARPGRRGSGTWRSGARRRTGSPRSRPPVLLRDLRPSRSSCSTAGTSTTSRRHRRRVRRPLDRGAGQRGGLLLRGGADSGGGRADQPARPGSWPCSSAPR